MNPYERMHAGVNAVCKYCKNIFTHHVTEVNPDTEYQCEGCTALKEQGKLAADGTAPAPEAIAIPVENTMSNPEEPAVPADHPVESAPVNAAVFPDGNKDMMIEHVTAQEALNHPNEAQGKPADAELETKDAPAEVDVKDTKKK